MNRYNREEIKEESCVCSTDTNDEWLEILQGEEQEEKYKMIAITDQEMTSDFTIEDNETL